MPGCSSTINKRGVEITFQEDTHKYSSVIDGKEIVYVSGTTFVESFFPKFDPDGSITRRCAKREGITEGQMRQLWKDKANRSCVYGTKIHECMEDRILGKQLRNKPSDDREKIVFNLTESLSKKILGRGEILGVEKIIFDERLGLAGTMDLLIRSKKDGKIWICDYKTNEKIETVNKYNSFGLKPIEHIPDISYHKYGMQLNLYEYILKKSEYYDENEKIGKVLFHITEHGIKSYPLPDYQKEISDMIKTFKERERNEDKI